MRNNKIDYVTSREAAQILGFAPDYIRKLIARGRLKAEKLGHNWVIHKANLRLCKRKRFNKKELSDGSSERLLETNS